jgi:hypothetical protein
MAGYGAHFYNGCIGYCATLPLTMEWQSQSDATSYDIQYNNQTKSINTVYSATGTKYVINSPSSGDHICVTMRAVNQYGASPWQQTSCFDTPY